MDLINQIIIITFVSVGVISGFLLGSLIFAFYRIHKEEKLTHEMAENRMMHSMHSSLHFKRR